MKRFKRFATFLVFSVILCLLAPSVARAAEKIGDWNGDEYPSGSVAGSQNYIKFSSPLLKINPFVSGHDWERVDLNPFYSHYAWLLDSVAVCSTGAWKISSWQGESAIWYLKFEDDSARTGRIANAFYGIVQTGPTASGPWYTIDSMRVLLSDSATSKNHYVLVDTLDFSNPINCGTFMRSKFKVDTMLLTGGQNPSARLTEWFTLRRTKTP